MAYRSYKACAAVAALERLALSNQEIWFLMELISIDKEESGFFSLNALKRRTSLIKGLDIENTKLADMVKALLGKTLLAGNVRGPWHKTADGNLVGHECEIVRDLLVLYGKLDRTLARTPRAVALIVAELRRICARDRIERPEQYRGA